MAPIRIGILGLSPGSWSATSHLPYLQSPDSKFEIVAVCNSSRESALRSINKFNLGRNTRAYENAQEIADDNDIDLVVCTTRVDRHYRAILPSLMAGKNVFVEWPLGRNLQEARSLLDVARQNDVTLTAVGFQGRFDASIHTLKDILAKGRIGKALSTTVNAQCLVGGLVATEDKKYLIDRDSGGSFLTIPASHLLDTVREALGEFSTFQSILANMRPIVKVVNGDGATVEAAARKTTPDHLLIQGVLDSGAVFSVSLRGGMPFKGLPALQWFIHGEKGEIKIEGPSPFIGIASITSFELHDFDTNEVEDIPFTEGAFAEMDPKPRNVGRIYEAIAAGDRRVLCDFEAAVRRHEFIEKVYSQNPGC